jgi:photosystem I P700 chlorophyll a apoprotein A2
MSEALPASRGQSTDWSNLLHQLPHPAGLKPFVTLEWGLYSTNGDQWNHVFGLADASVVTSVLSFLGTRMPSSDSLWLTDVAHHHLAVAVTFLVAGHLYRTQFSVAATRRDQCGWLR